MSSNDTSAAPTALTCSVCGANSVWHEAFTKLRDGTVPILCCPLCAERKSLKSQRLSLGVTFCALALAVAAFARGGGSSAEGLFIVVALFAAAQYPLVFLHEIGHALAAWAVRAPAYAIILGRGPWILDRDFAGIRWRFGKILGGGLTYHEHSGEAGSRVRGVVITAAGPAMNLLVTAALCGIAVALPGTFEYSFGKVALVVIAAASLTQFFVSAWPHAVKTSAGKLPSDGARIIGLLRGEFDNPDAARAGKDYMLASFAFADGNFPESARLARASRLAWTDADFGAAMTVLEAAALSESDNASAAVALLRPMLATGQHHPGIRAGAADNLGWAYFLLDEPGLIDEGITLVSEACVIAPWEASYSITHACLLAISASDGNGRAADARALLSQWKPRDLRRQNAAYSALAYGLIAVAERDLSEARRQLNRAQGLRATAAPLRVLERRIASG